MGHLIEDMWWVLMGLATSLIEDVVASLAEGDLRDARALEQVGADLRTRHCAAAAKL